MFGLKQLLEVPARVDCSTSTIIDHMLVSFPERVSQQDVINAGLTYHQVIYCTRKISRIKRDATSILDAVREKVTQLILMNKLWID